MRSLNIISYIFLFLIVFCLLQSILHYIDFRDNAKIHNMAYRSKYERFDSSKHNSVQIKDSENNLFWFIQVTDIHISKFSDNQRTPDLLKFCKESIPILKPDFVLVSGDLADSKSFTKQDSMQYEEEWKSYQNVIKDSQVEKHTIWLDLRGNHDSFNVPFLDHSVNFFKQYSVQGRQHDGSYYYIHKKPFGNYSIIGLDACPNPGPKRPYNFFGIITPEIFSKIRNYSASARTTNATIWFGHYPTSTIVTNNFPLRQLISSTSGTYVCGHLHTWNNWVTKMYTLQPEGYLELELGDWRDSRYFRIAAFDHDIFSFTDVKLDNWPYILVTNPKHSNFLMPHNEPVHKISSSTHIRILAWSNSSIKSVQVSIDGEHLGTARPVGGGPLYTLAWSPIQYSKSERHDITVSVTDENGLTGTVRQPFSSTGTPIWDFGYLASLLLLGEQSINIRVWYYSVWLLIFVPLVLMRLASFQKHFVYAYLDQRYIVAAYKLSNCNSMFIPVLAYLIYSLFGPLMFGELVEDHWGFVYLNGLVLKDTYIPDYSPYITEALQNNIFFGPFLLYLVYRIDNYSHNSCSSKLKISAQCFMYFIRKLFILIYIFLYCCFTFMTVILPYGLTCFVLSPCRVGALILAIFLLSRIPKAAHVALNEKTAVTNGPSNINGHPPNN